VIVPFPPGNKAINAAQIVGQAIGYGKRYSFAAALNIPTMDEDDAVDHKAEVLAALAAAKTADEIDTLGVEFKKIADKFTSDEQAEIKLAAVAARERVKIAGAAERVQVGAAAFNNGERVPDSVKDDVKILMDQNAILGPSVVVSPDNGHAESVQVVTPAPDQTVESPTAAIIDAINGAAPDGKVLHGAIQAAMYAAANDAADSVSTVNMLDKTAKIEDAAIIEARLLKSIIGSETAEDIGAAIADCTANKTNLDTAAIGRLSFAIRDRKAALEKKLTGRKA
jgi:cytochrome c551/c552